MTQEQAPSMGEVDREAFEVWARTRGLSVQREETRPDEYWSVSTHSYWLCWQAATLRERYVLDLLVAAGHVSAEKVEQARAIATSTRSSKERTE